MQKLTKETVWKRKPPSSNPSNDSMLSVESITEPSLRAEKTVWLHAPTGQALPPKKELLRVVYLPSCGEARSRWKQPFNVLECY